LCIEGEKREFESAGAKARNKFATD
jgi:hypothetical protein